MQKRGLSVYFLLFSIVVANALDIPKGTFYFDNSLTKYERVKFVYGSDKSADTWVVSMTDKGNNKWEITFPEAVTGMYRYTFANTTLPDGKINDTFPNVKEDISHGRGEYRTATTDATILVGGIFTPSSGENWAQGQWIMDTSECSYSKTLPVLFITTENNQPIVSKEDYIDATYYLETFELEGYEAIGSSAEQLPLEIRGRGNYTWRDFDKKPYRIKLGEKQEILGMKKSKHFALLAHADDNLGFYRNTMGFEFSRRIGMAYTPAQEPVEVVLNGDYIGLYFLTETIRVDKDRVNIVEQADEETDAEAITGGWLLEIDNYYEDAQVRITEGDGSTIKFTYKSPEVLSNSQIYYLSSSLKAVDNAIYVDDKSSTQWENLVDIDALVRFYIVQELMQNAESFNGSCYLYKDRGEDSKWTFGPVWDFGNSFHNGEHRFIYIDPPFECHWIHQFAKFDHFQSYLIDVWNRFYHEQLPSIDTYMSEFADKIAVAAAYDYNRWPSYGNADIYAKQREMKSNLDSRIAWLHSQWEDTGIENINDKNDAIYVLDRKIIASENIKVFNLNGVLVKNENLPSGIYIAKGQNMVAKVIVR